MRALLLVGTTICLLAGIFVFRIVLHAYSDHDHLDVFHLVVGMVAVVGGLLLLRGAYRHRSAGSP